MKKPIKRLRATTSTWAIETGLPSEPYRVDRTRSGFPLFFTTRRAARFALAQGKVGYRLPFAARAVRVAVTVTTIGRG